MVVVEEEEPLHWRGAGEGGSQSTVEEAGSRWAAEEVGSRWAVEEVGSR